MIDTHFSQHYSLLVQNMLPKRRFAAFWNETIKMRSLPFPNDLGWSDCRITVPTHCRAKVVLSPIVDNVDNDNALGRLCSAPKRRFGRTNLSECAFEELFNESSLVRPSQIFVWEPCGEQQEMLFPKDIDKNNKQ
jgi:hypothetical protein